VPERFVSFFDGAFSLGSAGFRQVVMGPRTDRLQGRARMLHLMSMQPLEGVVVGVTADRWEEQAELLSRRGAKVLGADSAKRDVSRRGRGCGLSSLATRPTTPERPRGPQDQSCRAP